MSVHFFFLLLPILHFFHSTHMWGMQWISNQIKLYCMWIEKDQIHHLLAAFKVYSFVIPHRAVMWIEIFIAVSLYCSFVWYRTVLTMRSFYFLFFSHFVFASRLITREYFHGQWQMKNAINHSVHSPQIGQKNHKYLLIVCIRHFVAVGIWRRKILGKSKFIPFNIFDSLLRKIILFSGHIILLLD